MKKLKYLKNSKPLILEASPEKSRIFAVFRSPTYQYKCRESNLPSNYRPAAKENANPTKRRTHNFLLRLKDFESLSADGKQTNTKKRMLQKILQIPES